MLPFLVWKVEKLLLPWMVGRAWNSKSKLWCAVFSRYVLYTKKKLDDAYQSKQCQKTVKGVVYANENITLAIKKMKTCMLTLICICFQLKGSFLFQKLTSSTSTSPYVHTQHNTHLYCVSTHLHFLYSLFWMTILCCQSESLIMCVNYLNEWSIVEDL